jgi:hypothetical protein
VNGSLPHVVPRNVAATESPDPARADAIAALTPGDAAGHQFVLYSDSCSGQPEHSGARRLGLTSAVVRRLDPRPEFIAFPGDAVSDGSDRRQWRHWLDVEMAWADQLGLPIYQSTSNHNTPNQAGYDLYREFWADRLPKNGPAGQETLSYWVRHGSLLYVCLHEGVEPDASPAVGLGAAEVEWLERVLAENHDAPHKFVAGHYPVHPLNGYTSASWCWAAPARDTLWDVLVAHGVTAYLTSHVLAYDARVHRGVLQITSGGAVGSPASACSDPPFWAPGFVMPGPTEYSHVVQLAVDGAGLRLQVLDAAGLVRERLAWPPAHVGVWTEGFGAWRGLPPGTIRHLRVCEAAIGDGMRPLPFVEKIDLLASPDGRFRVGFDTADHRLLVALRLAEHGWQRWRGPALDLARPVELELAFHPDLGPGGILGLDQDGRWTSLESASAVGLEDFSWPQAIHPASEHVRVRTAASPTSTRQREKE